jgi:hypothetical protein
LEPPTPGLFEQGCQKLGVHVGDSDELFAAYYLEGARARVAARVIESIAGLACDARLNDRYGFLELESEKRLRKRLGLGRFRFLRKGRRWMALGTHSAEATTDLRQRPIPELFGYRIWMDHDKIQISLSKIAVQQAKAELAAILESESQVYSRLRRVNEFYRAFHHQRRFANAMNWYHLDEFLTKRVRRMIRSGPKINYRLALAADNRPETVTYLPRRCNFFWNLEELRCPYYTLWNPYRWPQPHRVQQIIADSTTQEERYDAEEMRT